jgi:hypothetical protein
MNQIVKMDKIEEFNEAASALDLKTEHFELGHALKESPRSIQAVANGLHTIITMTYISSKSAIKLVNLIKNGCTIEDVDVRIVEKVEMIEEARRLLELYAEIHGLPLDQFGVIHWADVPKVDTITV